MLNTFLYNHQSIISKLLRSVKEQQKFQQQRKLPEGNFLEDTLPLLLETMERINPAALKARNKSNLTRTFKNIEREQKRKTDPTKISTSCCHTLLCTGLAKEGKRREEKTENTNTVSQQADYRGKNFSHTKETFWSNTKKPHDN